MIAIHEFMSAILPNLANVSIAIPILVVMQALTLSAAVSNCKKSAKQKKTLINIQEAVAR